MPIKFRCQHCQQLLGISRSRAGAIVDCPQCGRDLRVPELDGRTRRIPTTAAASKSDSALISALSELSVLDQGCTPAPINVASTSGMATVAEVTDQRHVAIDRLPVAEPVNVNTLQDTSIVEAGPVPIYEHESSHADSLAELADLHSHENPVAVSDSLLDEMRSVSHPVGISIASVIGGAFLLLSGLVAGWYFGRMKEGAELSPPAFIQPRGNRAEDAALPRRDAVPVSGADVTGRVQYENEAGLLVADAGATVIVIPRQRVGTIKLNARSLKLKPDHPDYVATLAAFSSYGGAVAKADNDGHFHVTAGSGTELIAIAVSRHLERGQGVPVSERVATILDEWFDSTSHLCGKLAVLGTPAAADIPVDIVLR